MCLRFIHVVGYVSTSFLFIAKLIFHCMDILYFVYSSIDGHLNCSTIKNNAIKNNASMNVFVQVFVWMYVFISLDIYT